MTDSEEILVLEPVEDGEDYDYEDVPVEEDAPKRRFPWPLALGIGLLVGLAIAFSISWFLRPVPYDSSALDAQIVDLREEMTVLQNRPAPVIPTVNLDPLTRRIQSLEARPTVDPLSEEIVSRLETLQANGFELPEMPNLPDFEAIETRLDALEAQAQSLDLQAQAQAAAIADLPAGGVVIVAPDSEPYVDPDTLPRFPAQVMRDGAAELGGSGFFKRTFSRHVRVRGSNAPDVLISGIESDLANGKPRAALAKFDRLPPQLRSLARAWRANMEEAL
jgi:hypothetical protein